MAAIPAAIANEALKKPENALKTTQNVINSPEAHIIAKASG